ncbi:hypothetical protein D3C79_985270 [compost metagenome]
MLQLGAHALHGFAGRLLQAANQGLDLAGSAGSALGQRANFFGHDGKAATHFPGARRFNCRIEGQQVGLFGNRANHR